MMLLLLSQSPLLGIIEVLHEHLIFTLSYNADISTSYFSSLPVFIFYGYSFNLHCNNACT